MSGRAGQGKGRGMEEWREGKTGTFSLSHLTSSLITHHSSPITHNPQLKATEVCGK